MGNSDSDSDNECFESAEESLDENEEVKSVGTKSKKSEKEVAEPVSDNVDSTPQVEKDVSSNSMSYRKRPDRVKRSNSNTTTKPIPRLPSTDAVFKADKIVPDAFFQDITSNLSKNINKSLSTLQQKSSNVKDLILSSLPVSSVNDDEGFTYDDNTVQTFTDETEIPNSEEEDKNKGHSGHLTGNFTDDRTAKKEEGHEEERLGTQTNHPILDTPCGSNGERKPPDIKSDSRKKSMEEAFTLNTNILRDNIEEETMHLKINEKQDVSDFIISNTDHDSSKEQMESVSEKVKENLQVSDVTLSNSSFILCDKQANNNNVKEPESINPLDVALEVTEVPHLEPVKSEIKSEPNSDKNKLLELQESNILPLKESKLIDSDTNAPLTEVCENLMQSSKNDLGNLLEEKIDTDLKCNLKELKTALESIVQDKRTTSVSEKEEISEKEQVKEGITEEKEKVEVNESLNDGWDDFDFSDEEVENIMTNKPEVASTEFKEAVMDNKIAAPKKMFSGHNGESIKPQTKVDNQTASKTNLSTQEKIKGVPKQIAQLEPVADDSWDWDDNWDETPEDTKEKAIVTSNPRNQKNLDDSSDLSKWSGWDTFAQKPQEKQGNWGLGSWGMDMLLNKATAVTQGISNVLEAGLGVPDPETFARMQKLEREKLEELEAEEPVEYSAEPPKKNSITNVNLFPVSGITSLVAGVTSKIVEHSKIQEIGSKVITGGLDTLETFGKKTMEVLQEGDPGLKNKRALLMGNNKPVLSQVLREAREKAEREMKKAEEKEMAKKCHFETLFDDFQGMVHLEALEMLSKQCELKLEQIRSGMNSEEQDDLNGILEEVEQLCALDECDLDFKSSVLDFKTALQMAVEPLKNEISVHRIIQIHENVNKWLEMSAETECSLVIINQKLVSTLAELAAATVQQFHKSGELLSVKECRKTVEEVDALSRLTNVLCTEINRLCEKFISLFNSKGLTTGSKDSLVFTPDKVTVVMQNSTSYIRQAFDLLIPVLQLGAAV